MNPSQTLLMAGMIVAILPMAASFLRQRSRFLQAGVLASAAGSIIFLFLLLRVLDSGPSPRFVAWVEILIISTVPLILSGYLLSAGLGRERPEESIRYLRRTFALLAAVGIAFLLCLRLPSFLSRVEWVDGEAIVRFGALGKIYLCYLLIGIVFIGYNLESTYRTASSAFRQPLRVPFLALFALLGYLTYILTLGILYSRIDTQKLVVTAVPFMLVDLFLAWGLVRGSLTDRGAPVSRSVVYSSFTALSAGLYVFAIGAVAQLSNFTHWSPDQVVTLTLTFLSLLVAVLFFVSNRFQRQVRRFIDRNFYVNRYDYRAQWLRVTEALDAVQSREEVFTCTAALLKEVFIADQITMAIRGELDSDLRPYLGKGVGHPQAVLTLDSPLGRHLAGERHAVLLDRRPDDFEYIPIYAENQDWLENTASQVVAPLFFGNELIGVMGLERAHTDDSFTFEDVALIDSIAGHVAAVLRAVELSQALAESREMELMSQWSNLILHDLKNYLAPLRMIAQNLEMHRHKPNIAEVSATDLHRVAGRMEALVRTISELRDNPEQNKTLLDLNTLVRDTLEHLQLAGRPDLVIQVDLRTGADVIGDPSLLGRVLENLITNAVEAMEGRGTLSISTEHKNDSVALMVSDSGPGMSEAFIRERLFRPFATTKRQGWGLGLFQCRSVIKSHGGKVLVESHPGLGSSFRITLPAAPTAAPVAEAVSVLAAPEGVPS